MDNLDLDFLKDKTIIITGGTGSFGQAFLSECLKHPVKEVRIFSRDEKKQVDLKRSLLDTRIRYFLGDIRDKESLFDAFKGVDYVFHAAAFKHVGFMEDFPVEAVKTNVLGTENVIQAAVEHHVKKVVFLSTDKAVNPINVMGLSKALMEKTVLAKASQYTTLDLIIVRYGNVIASRGSVIPLFVDKLKHSLPLPITDPTMTRFMMTMHDAIQLVFHALKNGKNGDMWIYKAKATSLSMLAKVLGDTVNKPFQTMSIQTTRGEKRHESLVGANEEKIVNDVHPYLVLNPLHPVFHSTPILYNSNDQLMDEVELKRLLLSDDNFKVLL
jgi:UDP-N-acetylglucosamine 4,6-dehydratase/5-epimerase